MIKQIAGGIVALTIGGTVYHVSTANVTNNFANNTGMSQSQAQQYVSTAQKNLDSFSNIGQSLTADGQSFLTTAGQVDCTNYTYTWMTASLTCEEGVSEMQTVGNNEVQLGNCYSSLDSSSDSDSASTINECISDIDATNSSYDLPIVTSIDDSSDITATKNANIYNKSVLQAALQSN